ncbi:uncharacterized protein GGS22DRAFT_41398 [Annulohypoxylon maeteangense]|uniref:uncharacterized protein n=1 Tax=Annulohypoxylon maeteangense TaxID=1927788 RepID=UPI0020089062|nr:uncharacterized protein GGS22DRAFT_41398 [Annulohypoxylon maeteangense]KAI0882815.1 hypothetical protein GGS22DRAFT_41398 [Annulohypoxylon maeteangense]
MRISKSSLPATLLPLLLLPGSSLGATVADRSSCIHISAGKFSAAAACGDKILLEYCFQRVPEYVELGDLERCFRNAGCTNAESGIEAAFLIHNCDKGQSVAELRRRSPEALPAPQDTTTTAAAATTTAASTGTTTATTATSTGLQCSTATTTTSSYCPVQSTGTASGSTLACIETTVTTSVCASTNICQTDSSGNDICMVRKDSLDTAELVITIFMAICFAGGFGTLLFFACSEKSRDRKLRAKKQAAAIAKTNAALAVDEAPVPAAPVEEPAGPFKREVSPAPGNPFADRSHY